MTYNLYLDESCHIEHDRIPVMCLAYTKVPLNAYEVLRNNFNSIKKKHKSMFEIKWSKLSNSRLPLYMELVDFFFDNPIDFRCILIKYKDRLRHEDFNQGSHDNFYYKMAYFLLRPNPPQATYRVFLDVKDHHGKNRLKKINEVFNNHHMGQSPFIHFQHIRSSDNPFFEMTDLFMGAISYKARVSLGEFEPTITKMKFIQYLEKASGFLLDEGTPPWESKFNIFDHQPKMQANERG